MADNPVPQPDSRDGDPLRTARPAPSAGRVAGFCFLIAVAAASGFIAAGRAANGLPVHLPAVIAWQCINYGFWLVAAAPTGWLARRVWRGRTPLQWLAPFAIALATVHAALAVALEAHFSLALRAPMAAAFAAQWPIDMLVATALAAGCAGLVAWQEKSVVVRALADQRELMAERRDRLEPLLVDVGSRKVPVAIDQIDWIGGAGNYAVVHWAGREGLVRETLANLERRLGLARVHRSMLANLARVESAQVFGDGAWRLRMQDGSELIVGRTQRDAILTQLGRAKASRSTRARS